jgi:hypothetical protein
VPAGWESYHIGFGDLPNAKDCWLPSVNVQKPQAEGEGVTGLKQERYKGNPLGVNRRGFPFDHLALSFIGEKLNIEEAAVHDVDAQAELLIEIAHADIRRPVIPAGDGENRQVLLFRTQIVALDDDREIGR